MSVSHKKLLASGITAILILVIISSNVSALGIAPAISEHAFTPGMEKTITLKIVNSEKSDSSVFISVDGELADYITIDTPEFEMTKDMEFKKISYTFKLPNDIGKPGPHESRILINTKPKGTESKGTQIAAKVVVYSRLRVFVPYPGEYAEIKLIAPNFNVGKTSYFGVEINNLGTEDFFADSFIEVLSPLNAEIASLVGDRAPVKSKETELVSIGWTPEAAGNMLAVSEVVYGEEQKSAKDEKKFAVGNPDIEIVNISADNFRLGGIAKFEIIIKSAWNEPIGDVYATFIIQDENGELYSRHTSEHVSISEMGMQRIPAYLETDKLSERRYQMKVILYYLDKEDEKIFDIDVGKDRIIISPTGQVISAKLPEKTEIEQVYDLLFIIIIIIVVSNVIIFTKLKRGRKSSYIQ